MKRINLLLIILGIICAMPIISRCAEYYVSTAGNDATGNGSIGNPWRTISYGHTRLSAGDTLFVRGGVYRENVRWGWSKYVSSTSDNNVYSGNIAGTDDAPITIRNYPGETPIMSGGGGSITGWTVCSSQEDALGNPHWKYIYKAVIPWAEPINVPQSAPQLRLIENGNFAFISSNKDQPVATYPTHYLFDTLTAGDDAVNHDQNLVLKDSTRNVQADGFWDGASIAIHQSSNGNDARYGANWIYWNKCANYAGNMFTFTAAHQFYLWAATPGDRSSYALFNHPALITRAGEYCYAAADGEGNVTIYFWPMNANNLASNIEYRGEGFGIYLGDEPLHPSRPTHPVHLNFKGLTILGYETGIYMNKNHSGPTSDSYLYFDDITISACGNATYGPNTNYQTFKNCRFSDCTGYGFMADGGQNVTIDGCELTNIGIDSFRQTGGTRTQFTRNSILQTSGADLAHGHGITINGLTNSLFAHNKIERPSLPFTTASLGKNVFIYGNIVGIPGGGTWSNSGYPGITENGSVYYVNNTILGLLGAYYTPNRYAINNIRAGIMGSFTPNGEVSSIGYDNASTVISAADLAELFVDGANKDYRRNPSPSSAEKYPLTGSSIQDFADLVKQYFPDYDLAVDIAGNSRILSAPIIGAYEYASVNQPPNNSNPENPSNPNTQNGGIPEKTELKIYNNLMKSANAQATAKLLMAEAGNATVKIYDSKGKEVIALFDGYKDAGTYDLVWAGFDSSGSKVGSGVYMVHVKAGSHTETKKIVVIK